MSKKKTKQTKKKKKTTKKIAKSEKADAKLYRTGEVLKQSGISRQMLYRYMQLDLIFAAETTETGRNLFAASVFRQIPLVQRLNQSGYTLRDIREIFSDRLRGM